MPLFRTLVFGVKETTLSFGHLPHKSKSTEGITTTVDLGVSGLDITRNFKVGISTSSGLYQDFYHFQ